MARARRLRRSLRASQSLLLAAALGSSIVGLSAPAHAEPLPVRTTGVVRRQGRLDISVGVSDLFDDAAKQHLFSGFATRVLLRIALHREDAELPVLLAFQRAEIVYDLWDERFHVRLTRNDDSEAVVSADTPAQAIALAASLWQFPLAEQRKLAPGRYFLVLRADLNPISEETLEDLRRWLGANGQGAHLSGVDGLSRSFVSVFFNPRLDDSERQIRFTSQHWQEPPR